MTKSEDANDKAKAAQAAAQKARSDAAKATADEVAENIQDAQNIEGPSRDAILGVPMTDDGEKAKQEATPKAVHSGDFISIDGDEGDLVVLSRKASQLGVLVDPKWDEARLRGEIQQAREGRADLQVKGVVPTSEQQDATSDSATARDKSGVDVMLSRDYWSKEDERTAAGTKIKVSREEAERLIAQGVGTYAGPIVSR